MLPLLASALLSCPPTKIVNHTKIWNKVDKEHIEVATKRCPTLYDDAPCLKLFTKKGELEYVAICGVTNDT